MVETTASATVDIEASPDAVYALLTDLSRISELSPECYRAEWEDGAPGPQVGASLRGYNRNGPMEWDARAVVLEADPGKVWAFEVPSDDGRATTWRYDIQATPTGCRVTESFDAPVLDAAFFQKIGRYDLLIENLTKSVENLKRVAEAG